MTKLKLTVKPEADAFTYVALIDVEYGDTYVSYYKEYAYKLEPIEDEVHFDSSNISIAELLQNVYTDLERRANLD